MSQRQLRVAELVQREVSLALRQGWTAEAALITVTRAAVTPDLRQVRVGYAVSGDASAGKAARALLRRIRGELRSTVGRTLGLKSTPELTFVQDDVTDGVARVQALLDEMSRKDAPKPDRRDG
ncbi:MAG: ribosome-binding factor A [Opitutia bacterium]